MNSITSYTDYATILGIINAAYSINATQMHLHRDLIGRVYFVDSPERNAVLKLYRPMDTEGALRTTSILEYLRVQNYPVTSIVQANNSWLSIVVDTPEGPSVGILFDHVDGTEPDIGIETEGIGAQVGRLHNLMEDYPYDLPTRTKAQYIDDYMGVMNELAYDPARIAELAAYGEELWGRLQGLPRCFCHGDMHTGNMLQTGTGRYVLFDFDEASGDWPVVDVAYLSDATNFNRFDGSACDETMRMFERFYSGYAKERSLSDAEIAAIPDIVAIRHYTILGRIIRRQGTHDISRGFLDEQYGWLMKWKELCDKKNT